MDPHAHENGPRTPPKWTGPPRRVLLLDDEPLILRAVGRSLRTAGLVVTATTSPDEAREIVASDPPDAVVSDLHMPTACGAEFLAEVAERSGSTIRILLSVDPDFRPKAGKLSDSRLHALSAKSEMGRLSRLIITLFGCRLATPDSAAAKVALAEELASAMSRPGHEIAAHRRRVGRWTLDLARQLGGAEDDALDVHLGAILHDVGQLTVPDHVFGRPGPLGDADRASLSEHPGAGARILDEIPAFRAAAALVASHHESWDGSGYPRGLGGTDIPVAVRAFRVADTFDALRTGRPYRRKRTRDEALSELEALAGRQLCPEAVSAFASCSEADLGLSG